LRRSRSPRRTPRESRCSAADGLIPANNISWGLRTVDGSYNNLIPGRTDWGSADQDFPRLLDPEYRPATESADITGGPLAEW
jgi:hypothetical protein